MHGNFLWVKLPTPKSQRLGKSAALRHALLRSKWPSQEMSDLRRLLHEMLKNLSRYFAFGIHLSLVMSLGPAPEDLADEGGLGSHEEGGQAQGLQGQGCLAGRL